MSVTPIPGLIASSNRIRKIVLVVLIFLTLLVNLSAQPWLQVETDRFFFIFQQGQEYTAQRAVEMSDRFFEYASQLTEYIPREKIPVVIYSNTAVANGFFTPLPPHIAIFVTGPNEDLFGGDWIEGVFLHELVHYFHIMQPTGFFGSLSRFFGRSFMSLSLFSYPGFMIEGPTVYAETAFIQGGRGDSSFFEAENAAFILEKSMYSYAQAQYNSPVNPGRFYHSGYLMVDYLQRVYGDQAFAELNRHFIRWPFSGANRAIRRVTGLRAREFYAAMVEELEQRWAYRKELPTGQPLLPQEPGQWSLPIETERGLITLMQGPYRTGGVYLLPRGSKNPEDWVLIAPLHIIDLGSWTIDPQGNTLIISNFQPDVTSFGVRAGSVTTSFSELWAIDISQADGSGRLRSLPIRRITENTRLFHPALSPDGSVLVAVEHHNGFSRLVQVDQQSGEVKELLSFDQVTFRNPSFSPDGKMLAVGLSHQGKSRILLANVTGSNWIQLEVGNLGPNLPENAQVYHPRFFQSSLGLELWFGGAGIDREESLLLGVYRIPVSQTLQFGTLELMVEDQFGAYGGFPLYSGSGTESTLVYGSYRINTRDLRFVTSSSPIRSMNNIPQDFVQPQGVNILRKPVSSEEVSELALDTVRYRDLPRTTLWLPSFFLRSGRNNRFESDFGFELVSTSLLGYNSLNIRGLYNPWINQPSAGISYSTSLGASTLTTELNHDYDYLPESSTQSELTLGITSVSASLSRPLWTDIRPNIVHGIFGALGLSLEMHRALPGEQNFLDLYQDSNASIDYFMNLSASVRWFTEMNGSARNLLGNPGRSLGIDIELSVPLFSDGADILVANTSTAEITFAPWERRPGMIGASHIASTISMTTNTAGEAMAMIPYRSGGFSDSTTLGAEGRDSSTSEYLALLGRLEHRVPIALLDVPFLGLNLTSISFINYVEQGFTFSDVTASSVLGNELVLGLGYGFVQLDLTLGFAHRLPHVGSNRSYDWKFYFQIGSPVPGRLPMD